MRISSVTYRRLVSFGRYENEAVEVAAEVPEGGDPNEVLASLKDWVDDKLAIFERERRVIEDARRARLHEEWKAAQAEQARHVGLLGPGDLPF